jgi:hypothetical protein
MLKFEFEKFVLDQLAQAGKSLVTTYPALSSVFERMPYYKEVGFSKSVIPAEVGVLFLKKPTNQFFFFFLFFFS